MQILETEKKKKTNKQRTMVTKNSNEAQGPKKPRQIRDTESAISKFIKVKQSTKDMFCENKLTDLVFKKQENSAKHNLLPFSFFLFFF